MPGVPYNAFGYSLSGGMDLDRNGYPDLLTSSFCSDRVLLIRYDSVIFIKGKERVLVLICFYLCILYNKSGFTIFFMTAGKGIHGYICVCVCMSLCMFVFLCPCVLACTPTTGTLEMKMLTVPLSLQGSSHHWHPDQSAVPEQPAWEHRPQQKGLHGRHQFTRDLVGNIFWL